MSVVESTDKVREDLKAYQKTSKVKRCLETIFGETLKESGDASVTFGDVQADELDVSVDDSSAMSAILERLGFQMRVRGSHHVFRRDGIEDLINLQRDGSDAKPYQVRQVRAVIVKHRLAGDKDTP